jgi:predicted dinucleotide-binding enzyme
MKIGILGSGDVGKVLASGFLKHGYEVMIGTRDSGKLTQWAAENSSGKVGSFSETAGFGELVVLAVKGMAAANVLGVAGAGNLAGKPVIDVTNPIADDAFPPMNGVLSFFTNKNESLMERLQSKFPKALFVKAFNSVGSYVMVNPHFEDGMPTMFICGNDESAKSVVSDILSQFGWETMDMGSARAACAIESLCILWCIPGFLRNEWTHAFKLLR